MKRKVMHLNLDPDTYEKIVYATERLKKKYGRPMLGHAAIVTDLVQCGGGPLPARPAETNHSRRKKKPPTA